MIKNKTVKSKIILFGIFTSVVELEFTMSVNDDNVCFLKSYWIRDNVFACNEKMVIPTGIEYRDHWYWNELAGKLSRKAHLKNFYYMFKSWVLSKDYLNSDTEDDMESWEN